MCPMIECIMVLEVILRFIRVITILQHSVTAISKGYGPCTARSK